MKQMIQGKINEKGLKERKMKRLKERGITLISLVVTIVIMLILAGVAIQFALGENGLFVMSKKSTNKYKEAQINEQEEMKLVEKELEELAMGTNIKATVNGETTYITRENVGQYLGMKVSNFKDTESETEDVIVNGANGNDNSNEITVSTKYRLYYIDFDNKYKDGVGTIYLKAECTKNEYDLQLDTADEGKNSVKIKQLNPSLYAGEKVQLPKTNPNMQAVTWLLNEENWLGVKESDNVKKEIKEKINYIVGAPSLEMMIDSYNMHYDLIKQGDKPVSGAGDENGEKRKKLFYRYEGENGYEIGPRN